MNAALRARSSRFLVLGLAAAVLSMLVLVRHGFGVELYPWVFPDSFDWLANGLAYAGASPGFSISHRGLLYTLLCSLAFRLDRWELIPLIGTAAFALTLLLVYRGCRDLATRRIAVLATGLCLFAYPLLVQSGYLGADVLAVAMLTGLTFGYLRYLRSGYRLHLVGAAVWAGLGIHSQYIEVVWLPILLVLLGTQVRDDGIAYSLRLQARRATSMDVVVASVCGILVAGLVLLPRLMRFGIIYDSQVVHLPLVSFTTSNIAPYLVATAGQLSWPVCAAALTGVGLGWIGRRDRGLVVVSSLWILTIGSFFGLVYSWFDVRFVVYVTVPVCVLAAIAVDGFAARMSPGRWQPAVLAGSFIVLVAAQLLRPSSYPFTGQLLLLPDLAVEAAPGEVPRFVRDVHPGISLAQIASQGRAIKEDARQGRVESRLHSPSLRGLFRALPSGRENDPIAFVEQLTLEERYIVKNRNIVYRGGRVDTFPSLDAGAAALRTGAYTTLVASRPVAGTLFPSVPSSAVIASSGPYLALDAASMVSHLRGLPSYLAAVSATDFPHALFDGIVDDPMNFGASPLGKPVRVSFRAPTEIETLTIHLYDFDDRVYRLSVVLTCSDSGEERLWHRTAEAGERGRVTLSGAPCPATDLDIIGISNSNTLTNPANTIIHIKELELTVKE